jgi:hypothetical protein
VLDHREDCGGEEEVLKIFSNQGCVSGFLLGVLKDN